MLQIIQIVDAGFTIFPEHRDDGVADLRQLFKYSISFFHSLPVCIVSVHMSIISGGQPQVNKFLCNNSKKCVIGCVILHRFW